MKIVSPLSDRCKQIIFGSILGDGSLKVNRAYRNARFAFRHSVVNHEYFEWKVSELKEISSENSVWQQMDSEAAFGRQKLRYQSRALESLTEIYDLTHHKNRLVVRRKWLNRLTPLSLCVWWLDDGSLLNGKQGVFCTDEFPVDELLLIVRYFRIVWKVHLRIGKVSKEGSRSDQHRLWFQSKTDLVSFLRLIMPHVRVPMMLKKVLLLYGDPNLQQRWISEVSQATGMSMTLIEAEVHRLKSKLSRFRK